MLFYLTLILSKTAIRVLKESSRSFDVMRSCDEKLSDGKHVTDARLQSNLLFTV